MIRGRARVRGAVLAMLAASAVCLAVAPLVVGDGYSVVGETVSSSAGQGIEGAWVARFGFLLWGFAVLVLVPRAPSRWGPRARWLHTAFAVAMVAAAAFAAQSWHVERPYDEGEELLHTIASFGAGTAFALGVLAIVLRGPREQRSPRAFDVLAIAAAVVLPVGIGVFRDVAGVLQRSLFVVAYAWYGLEAWGMRAE